MKLLFVSNLFPDQAEPVRGLDNATLLHHLGREWDIRVICPRPALPGTRAWSRKRLARPEDAKFQTEYLSAAYVPKVGSPFNHRLFHRALAGPFQRMRESFPFDRVLVSWAYPDAWAVSRCARLAGVPFVAVTQGSDVHTYLANPIRRSCIREALGQASAVINRSADLTRRLREIGISETRLHTVYNGVDTNLFRPGNRMEARRKLGWPESGRVILFVGNFLPVKNPGLMVEAWLALNQGGGPGVHLAMIGDGPLRAEAESRVSRAGRSDQVWFGGRRRTEEVALAMRGADLLCLSSRNEGFPNVILEALASGLPVVSTNVGGIREILGRPELGRLVPANDSEGLATALKEVLNAGLPSEEIRRVGEQFTWAHASGRYHNLLLQGG